MKQPLKIFLICSAFFTHLSGKYPVGIQEYYRANIPSIVFSLAVAIATVETWPVPEEINKVPQWFIAIFLVLGIIFETSIATHMFWAPLQRSLEQVCTRVADMMSGEAGLEKLEKGLRNKNFSMILMLLFASLTFYYVVVSTGILQEINSKCKKYFPMVVKRILDQN